MAEGAAEGVAEALEVAEGVIAALDVGVPVGEGVMDGGTVTDGDGVTEAGLGEADGSSTEGAAEPGEVAFGIAGVGLVVADVPVGSDPALVDA